MYKESCVTYELCRVPIRYLSAGIGVLHTRSCTYDIVADVSIRGGDVGEDVSL